MTIAKRRMQNSLNSRFAEGAALGESGIRSGILKDVKEFLRSGEDPLRKLNRKELDNLGRKLANVIEKAKNDLFEGK